MDLCESEASLVYRVSSRTKLKLQHLTSCLKCFLMGHPVSFVIIISATMSGAKTGFLCVALVVLGLTEIHLLLHPECWD